MYAESVAIPRRGFAGALTATPSACRRSITPFQLEASANAPCTRTTVGDIASDMRVPFRWEDASAQRPERGANLLREELRLLPGGEVAAPVHLVEVAEAGIGRLGPTARGPPDLAGERREADRHPRRWKRISARRRRVRPIGLPVRPGRRG